MAKPKQQEKDLMEQLIIQTLTMLKDAQKLWGDEAQIDIDHQQAVAYLKENPDLLRASVDILGVIQGISTIKAKPEVKAAFSIMAIAYLTHRYHDEA